MNIYNYFREKPWHPSEHSQFFQKIAVASTEHLKKIQRKTKMHYSITGQARVLFYDSLTHHDNDRLLTATSAATTELATTTLSIGSQRRRPARAPPMLEDGSRSNIEDDDPINSPRSITTFLEDSFSSSIDLPFQHLDVDIDGNSSSFPAPQARLTFRPRARSLDLLFPDFWETTDYISIKDESTAEGSDFRGRSDQNVSGHPLRASSYFGGIPGEASHLNGIFIPEI